jgi:hypothetical protein
VTSFDRLKRPLDRLPGHKLKPSRWGHSLVQNSKPHLSMKISYFLGIDAAKHKIRAALSQGQERFLFENDLPVTASARKTQSRITRLLPAQTGPKQTSRSGHQPSHAHPHPQSCRRASFPKTL